MVEVRLRQVQVILVRQLAALASLFAFAMCRRALNIPREIESSVHQKIHILLVSHELTPTGAVLSLIHLHDSLLARGHDVELLSLGGGYLGSVSAKSNISWIQSDPMQVMEKHPSKYDVIVANTIVADVWLHTQYEAFGTSFSDRIVWYVRELPIGYEAKRRYLYQNMATRKRMMQLAKAVIFVSHSSKALYADHYDLFRADNFRVVQNAVHQGSDSTLPCNKPSHLKTIRKVSRLALGIPARDTVVLSMGKFSRQKGSIRTLQEFLAGGAQQNFSRHVLFVGDIEMEFWSTLRNLFLETRTDARYSGGQARLHVLGAIASENEIHQYYSAANIMVLNSKCEAFGRVILESFAHGIPVVARGCGGPAEIIEHGSTGFLFSTETDLMWYIDHLTTNPEILRSISKRACNLVDTLYNPTQHLTVIESVLEQVAGKTI